MIGIPNRPFAAEPISGMMLPDGFFEASLGMQTINAHFRNLGNSAIDTQLYFESASHPAFAVTPQTFAVNGLPGGADYLGSWSADVSGVPPGTYLVSFIAQVGATQTRIIKKVFVTKVTFDPSTNALSAAAPEGTLVLVLTSVMGPASPCGTTTKAGGGGGCGCRRRAGIDDGRDISGRVVDQGPTTTSAVEASSILNDLKPIVQRVLLDPASLGCPLFYLLKDGTMSVVYDQPFSGQYGDLAFEDPWWKVLLIIIAIVLAIACIVVAVVASGGTAAVGIIPAIIAFAQCCTAPLATVAFEALGTGAVAAGAAAAFSDERDLIRRGQDNTIPASDELTISESVKFSVSYPEPVALGRPFAVTTDWQYERLTTGNTYSYSASDVGTNVHVLDDYEITAPNIVRVYERQPFLITGKFFDAQKELMKGSELYVQCFLEGIGDLEGRFVRFLMQDSGIYPDQTANDGTYTGIHHFGEEDHGYWKIYVIAQDVNDAQPDMTPEDAAQIIGGMIRTHQLTISFQGGTCKHVPDGEVHVLSNYGS